jgi:hypothetical protein
LAALFGKAVLCQGQPWQHAGHLHRQFLRGAADMLFLSVHVAAMQLATGQFQHIARHQIAHVQIPLWHMRYLSISLVPRKLAALPPHLRHF